EAWAQLFNTSDGGLALELLSDRCQIGRAVDCDLSLAGNQFVSGHHCAVFKDPDGGDDVITVCPLPGNSTVAFRLKLLGHEQPDEASESGSAKPPQTMVIPDTTLPITDGDSGEDPTTDQRPTKRTRTDEAKDKANKSAHSQQSANSFSRCCRSIRIRLCFILRFRDPMEANLNCTICCEIFHDCVTLIPCLHGYCAGCYSQWQRTNPVCPQCRVRPERVTKERAAEAYLAAHPERRRPAEELEKLDSLTTSAGRSLPVVRQSPADEDESDEEDEDSDDDGNAGVAYFGMNQAVRVRRAVPTYQLHRVGDPTAFAARLRRQCRATSRPTRRQPLAAVASCRRGPAACGRLSPSGRSPMGAAAIASR
uniref:E3 ubiquitin-protein ligase CHFR n=1 Tax=Macrostomum lignano TaxID=282301 RepID=A0A1I8F9R7_9PLAT